ncbi:CAP family protein [Croceicoccus marinus]|uniref:SCP-like extracellular n=1 Tax=Croceicoccus marinus TaxID=450378 RepID=A0A7G6VQE8_9SPHN|nr:CAP family protein [Croceicoccus marinus]QNE03963.1 SCP-like extracellular [Croceicoccus marinus]
MKHEIAAGLAALGALVAAAVLPASAQQQWGYSDKYPRVESVPAGSFAQRLLDAHNDERDRVGVPPLEWDPRLAAEAGHWAAELARRQSMDHADPSARRGAGENLWRGTERYYTAEEMIGTFIDEKRHFQLESFPDVSATGQWRDVGHYTQLIWRDTERVGCAVAAGGGQDWLVCRYWPAGNVMGQPVL